MDFSAAVRHTDRAREDGRIPSGHPTYINYTGRMTAMRGSGPLLGRDHHGDWWMQWTLRAGAWVAVEQHLQELAASVDKLRGDSSSEEGLA